MGETCWNLERLMTPILVSQSNRKKGTRKQMENLEGYPNSGKSSQLKKYNEGVDENGSVCPVKLRDN